MESLKSYSQSIDKIAMKKYYSNISDDELYSFTKITFDLWQTITSLIDKIKKHSHKRKIRVVDVGGGKGDISAIGLKLGYEILLTDIFPDFLKEAESKYPKLKGKTFLLDIFNEEQVIEFINEQGFFDVVLCLGFVLNHTDSQKKFIKGFENLIKLSNSYSIIVIDLMISDMYIGKPSILWSDFHHYLPSLEILTKLLNKHGLVIEAFHSIKYDYGEYKNYHYQENGARFFLLKFY